MSTIMRNTASTARTEQENGCDMVVTHGRDVSAGDIYTRSQGGISLGGRKACIPVRAFSSLEEASAGFAFFMSVVFLPSSVSAC